MFSCLRRADRRESDGMGHVCIMNVDVKAIKIDYTFFCPQCGKVV